MENDFQQLLGKKFLESLFFLAALGAGIYFLLRFFHRAPFSFRFFRLEYDMHPVVNLIVGIGLCAGSIWILIAVVLVGW